VKKIKIFLGLACLIVALASAAFTKANANFYPEYYISWWTGTCEQLPFDTGCEHIGVFDCRVDLDFGEWDRQVYNNKIEGQCYDPLYRW